jgi:peptidoglycan/xylan/chitin deacetylase (PgdA/CDA1 family)
MIIPVLMYHSVDLTSCDYLTVSQRQFKLQMDYLQFNYNILPLRDIQNLKHQSQTLRSPIIISFDDSFKNNIDYALPVLGKLKIKAIFFVIATYIGKNNLWDHKAYSISQHMSKNDLLLLQKQGHDLGNHSLTHQRLSKLPDLKLEEEFKLSNNILTEILNNKPIAFSYPYGDADNRCLNLCKDYYKFGFATTKQGVFDWQINQFNIRRIYVSPHDGPKDLQQKINYYLEGYQHA